MTEIKSSLPPQRCPFCNELAPNGVCSTVGCKAYEANQETGYTLPIPQEEYPEVTVEV